MGFRYAAQLLPRQPWNQTEAKADGYATDSKYIAKNMEIMEWYDLIKYDVREGEKMGEERKVIAAAEAEVGYLEKKSNSQLEDKTANAGKNNYTKFGQYFGMNGQPWCDMFVDWCFIRAYGRDTASKLLCGGFSAYTPTSAQYYKNKGQWHSTPKIGDQIFFRNSERINHTGLVYRVSGNTV